VSHFKVIVCLDDRDGALARAVTVGKEFPGAVRSAVENKLETLLAPYDENREAAPYRSYEEGGPEEYWLYRTLKQADEDERNGTGILPYKPDQVGWSSNSSKQTTNEQKVEIARKASLFRSLPEPVTWEAVIDMGKIIYPDEDSSEWPAIDENDRAYKMSTYNPESKWDWWSIGGRYGARLSYRPEHAGEIVFFERSWDSPTENVGLLRCDGGRKGALDLDAVRDDAAKAAVKIYREYHALVDHLPEALPWRVFADNISEGNGYTIGQAREEYRAQPRVVAVQGTDLVWRDDAISEFGVSEELYENKARAGALPGFALVTTDGRWMEQGRMGWWAMTDATDESRTSYQEAANAYIESLPDDAWLVIVDCHI
jgi:hypothetical protein